VVNHLFGDGVGPPVLYGVVAMGGVFAGAAQAPLTAVASVAEMTGNFTLTLPIMLACGIASQLAKRITHGSIYTTKLLRRGIDIERPKTIEDVPATTLPSTGPEDPDRGVVVDVAKRAARPIRYSPAASGCPRSSRRASPAPSGTAGRAP
jgi:hypothetical protein